MNYRSILLATVQTVALFMSGFFIPLLAWMVTPVPLILAYVRSGKLDSLIALGLSSFIIAFVGGWHIAVFLVLMLGLMAISQAESLLRQRNPEIAILLGALPSIVVMGFVAGYYFIRTGKNPATVVETYFHSQRAEAATLYDSLGFNEVAAAISSISDASVHFFVQLLPCIAILTMATIAACSYGIARALLTRKPGGGPTLVPISFGLWHAPDTWVWGLIAALAFFMIPADTAKIVGWNLSIPFAALYLIQGVALVDHFLKEKIHVHPAVRIVIHSIILSLPSVLFVIVAGVMDIWADFRKLRGPVQKA
jgi:hypothetical protein